MNRNLFIINSSSFVTDIVTHDYRAADVFRKYDIDFCCGGKWTLEAACEARGVDTESVLQELRKATRPVTPGIPPDFDSWEIDFLADYILNIHHRYLQTALPEIVNYVGRFLEGHRKKYPELGELETILQKMQREIPPHMKKEEEVIFPYIKQIYHAWQHRESYASLLIRTLRKPVEDVMLGEHETVGKQLQKIRSITNHYTLPPGSCLTHRVTFAKLQELDNDLQQHIHLENNILFPKALEMERELLLYKD